MSYVLPGETWITLSLQNIGDWLTPIMEFFTWLGYPQAYMILIAIIYWSVDRKLGLRMAIFLTVVSSMNIILKQAFHAPRPYWVDPGIKAILVSNGFGMPSGHAQAATVWLYAGSLLRRRWFWAISITLVLMVGMSRVYLGLHFCSQMLAGWAIGIIMLILFIRFESNFLSWFLNRKFKWQLLIISGISTLLLILGGIFVFILRDWEMPAEWIFNAMDDLAGVDETILFSIGFGYVAGYTGSFLGVGLGALLNHRRGGFEVRGLWWKRILRSAAGLAVFLALYGIFMVTAPDQAREALYSIWRFSGFFVISFSAIFLVPLLLMRINLLEPGKEKKA